MYSKLLHLSFSRFFPNVFFLHRTLRSEVQMHLNILWACAERCCSSCRSSGIMKAFFQRLAFVIIRQVNLPAAAFTPFPFHPSKPVCITLHKRGLKHSTCWKLRSVYPCWLLIGNLYLGRRWSNEAMERWSNTSVMGAIIPPIPSTHPTAHITLK